MDQNIVDVPAIGGQAHDRQRQCLGIEPQTLVAPGAEYQRLAMHRLDQMVGGGLLVGQAIENTVTADDAILQNPN